MNSITYSSRGIIIKGAEFIALDPVAKPLTETIFVSHPHSDHHPKTIKRRVKLVASQSTHNILKYKLKTFFKHKDKVETEQWTLQQIPSGHMFGSTSLLLTNNETNQKILYTGDVNNVTRFGLKGFKPPKVDILIIEATYGNPKYVFPDPETIISEAYDLIEELSKKKTVFIHSYALGKAQLILSSPLNHLIDGVTPQISTYNKLFSPSDFKTKNDVKVVQEPKNTGVYLVSKVPKNKPRNSVTFFFTGWALSRFNSKYAYPLSDHADFHGLLDIIKQSQPEQVFTVYGYSNEFAQYLRKIGFSAFSLTSKQSLLEYDWS